MAFSLHGIISWGGKTLAATLAVFHKFEAVEEVVEPQLVKYMTEIQSVTSLIPGVGPELGSALNIGIQLLGFADKALHSTDVHFKATVADLQKIAPAGQTVILVSFEVQQQYSAFLSEIKTEYDKVKFAVDPKTVVNPPTIKDPIVVPVQPEELKSK